MDYLKALGVKLGSKMNSIHAIEAEVLFIYDVVRAFQRQYSFVL